MSRHASLEDLACYIEGALKPRKSSKVASHLAGCSYCSGHVQDLQQVPTMLSNVDFPPIPAHLSARIEIAIAAEVTTRVSAEPASGEASRRDLPARAGRSPRRRWRMPGFSSPLAGSLAAVGAAVVIAGGGYEIASNLGGTGTSGSPSSAHQAPAASPPGNGAAAAAGPVRSGPEVQYRHDGKTESLHSVETGTNFVPDRLQAQAETELRAARTGNLKSSQQQLTSPYANPAATNGINAGQLSGCVDRIASGRDVFLVDVAKYLKKPATIIVVGTRPGGSGTVYAVGPGCSASNGDILGQQPLQQVSP